MKRISLLAGALILASMTFGQSEKKMQDLYAIKAMQGCFDVKFEYAETFSPVEGYEKADNYEAHGLEWVEMVESDDKKVVLQHLLIVNDSTVIKHWRQDWVYESDHDYTFALNNTWIYNKLNNKQKEGKWTQFVYQVDDSPRYSGTATWTHADGISSWYNMADSPLPRREYTKRQDYNLMKRGNRVNVVDGAWVHEQDNEKVMRTEDGDELLAMEKGYNTYTKVDDSRCSLAQEWWASHGDKWNRVRKAWDTVCNQDREVLALEYTVDNKVLHEHLFGPQAAQGEEEISSLIRRFVKE
jgi:hypothetical protein